MALLVGKAVLKLGTGTVLATSMLVILFYNDSLQKTSIVDQHKN